MVESNQETIQRSESLLATHKVLRNTYALLSMTLVFSGFMAWLGMSFVTPMMSLVFSIAAIGLLWFVIPRTANSSTGLAMVFLFTGLLGAGLGPMLSMVVGLPGGASMVMQALVGTGVIFATMSGIVLTTKKDFSFLGGFIMIGMLVIVGALIASIFMPYGIIDIAISAGIVLIMSLFILFDTSRIVRGGETNYIMATVGLYVSLYNLFTSLLHLIMAFSGDD
ncbi:Bax inhibitor-1/YccA family protein [Salinibius halmophilus]|uniref:Bax inhibitor-1/YccA family protein n=1 Tax=Salinibius halmophilus TaxID=1853216 RepID=UPI000E6618C9|nr:Bax inhibitor-1/YccA family protein [Salinibius halmophilus]